MQSPGLHSLSFPAPGTALPSLGHTQSQPAKPSSPWRGPSSSLMQPALASLGPVLPALPAFRTRGPGTVRLCSQVSLPAGHRACQGQERAMFISSSQALFPGASPAGSPSLSACRGCQHPPCNPLLFSNGRMCWVQLPKKRTSLPPHPH